MILCSCTRLTETELRRTLEAACAADPWRFVTPARAFHMSGRRMKCGYCAKLVSAKIAAELARLQNEPLEPPTQEGRDP